MAAAIIILAAGESARLGRPKQALPWGDDTLLTHAVSTALQSSVKDITVVLGSRAEENQQLLAGLPISVSINPSWQKGMGASLKHGLEKATSNPDTDRVLVMVCDQPFVTAAHINELIQTSLTTAEIVASEYLGVKGVPAVFQRRHFDAIRQLGDAEGAKRIIATAPAVVSVVLKNGEKDIDTLKDYLQALNAR